MVTPHHGCTIRRRRTPPIHRAWSCPRWRPKSSGPNSKPGALGMLTISPICSNFGHFSQAFTTHMLTIQLAHFVALGDLASAPMTPPGNWDLCKKGNRARNRWNLRRVHIVHISTIRTHKGPGETPQKTNPKPGLKPDTSNILPDPDTVSPPAAEWYPVEIPLK